MATPLVDRPTGEPAPEPAPRVAPGTSTTPSPTASLTIRAANDDPLPVTDASVVRTFALVPQALKSGQWLVVRPGTAGVLLTSDVGLDVLTRFRRGAAVRDVKAHLARTRAGAGADAAGVEGATRINLDPLLKSAADAGFIKSVDGVRARAPRLDVARLCLHLFKIRLYPSLFALVDRLPLALRERLLFHLQWWFEGRFAWDAGRARTRHNLGLLFPDADPASLDGKTREFYRQRTRSHLSFLTTRKDVPQVLRWLDVFVKDDVEGEERLRASRAAGRGLIVVSAHYGCFWMIPAWLFQRGLKVHVLMASVSERQRALERAWLPGRPDARLKFYSPSLRSLIDLAQALADGGVVLVYADTHGSRDTASQRFVHQAWGKAALAKTPFSLLGHPFPVEGGVSWLHRQSGSPVLPAVLHPRAGSWRVRMSFGEPLMAPPRADESDARPAFLSEAEITRGVYGQLEAWIRQSPEQWVYLNGFPTKNSDPRATRSQG